MTVDELLSLDKLAQRVSYWILINGDLSTPTSARCGNTKAWREGSSPTWHSYRRRSPRPASDSSGIGTYS